MKNVAQHIFVLLLNINCYKKVSLFLFLILLAAACKNDVSSDGPITKYLPDHTPYIIGLIQYSPDTTFHYPEVVVGYFTDTQTVYSSPQSLQKLRDLGILVSKHLHPQLHYKGLYSIMLTRQLTTISTIFSLNWQPESNAVVTVSGPLGTSKEKEVVFTSEGNGVYGDKGYDLPRIPDGKYKLLVKLPDGRMYISKTYIPDRVSIKLKDSVSTKVYLKYFNDGEPHEAGANNGYPYTYQPPQNGFLTVIQWNSNRDWQLLLVKPGQKLRYSGYGNYLRKGAGYAIGFTQDTSQIIAHLPWQQNLAKSRDKIWNSEHWWLRLSFFSTGVGKEFETPFIWVSSNLNYLMHFDNKPGRAAEKNDTTYLHRVSTIRKLGKNGKVLPKDSSDAIGFFGGEYSRYLQTTLYPIRTFNLDSVWNAWHENQ